VTIVSSEGVRLGRSASQRPFGAIFVLFILLFSMLPSMLVESVEAEDNTHKPEDLWSFEYITSEFPWGGDDAVQFKEYHDYFTMRDRMMVLADRNPDFIEFHEGLPGGVNARGNTMTADDYKGWFYKQASPWVKITANVRGGECNDFVGDCGNYEDRPDVMLVGNHHAREWMSYEVPMLFLETIAYYYGKAGIDNDGDGLIDEDPWGDADGDGILDDDGDCLSLDQNFSDSNGDGIRCGPGDLGVDEGFSEQWITDLVNTREVYLIPMLNVDGNRYDREVYCGPTAWENCRTSGWRKNLRDNTVTGVTPIPDVDEEVDEGCDGVDLNRNFQFEWGAPLGATGPLFPGMCYAGGPNNDVYNGPVDTVDNDGDGRINEDHVDGKDDDADGLVDEDWWGGNSEPETKFIQDMTEMNDDDGDGASEFKVSLTWHSYSELVLWPWGHCTECKATDDAELVYHGEVMAEMTAYDPMQSSSLYPTTGDFCDWHYGVHRSFCYTIEIGTAFHQSPDEIDHMAVRNLGIPFYMMQIADNPHERAYLGMGASQTQYLTSADNLTIPERGDVILDMCLDSRIPYTLNPESSYVEWRMVKPSRTQQDYGPAEWLTSAWAKQGFAEVGDAKCELKDGSNGTIFRADVPVPEDTSGKLHYKASLATVSGTFPLQYPAQGQYEIIDIPYRAPYGDPLFAFIRFAVIAGAVWGGLGRSLWEMMHSGEDDQIPYESNFPESAD